MSAAQLRDAVDAKWAIVASEYTKTKNNRVHVPVIYTWHGYNIQHSHVTMKPSDVIFVDGHLMVRRDALERAAHRELPEWKVKHKVDKKERVKTHPYTMNHYRHLQIKYSASRKKHR